MLPSGNKELLLLISGTHAVFPTTDDLWDCYSQFVTMNYLQGT